MSKIRHLATVGCSHSSHMVGLSWPDFLKEDLSCMLNMAYSSGAGNEMNLEKVKHLLNNTPDLLIVQLTDPARLTTGIYNPSATIPNDVETLTNSYYIGNSCYYTFNPHDNNQNLENLIGRTINADDFIIKNVLLSDYNLYYKVMHTISSMAFLAKAKNVPVVFFSWSVDIHELISQHGYTEFFKDLLIIPSYIEQFVKDRKLSPIPHGSFGSGHHGPANQKIISQEFIMPYLKEKQLV